MVYWIWIEVTDDCDWLIFKFKQYKCVNIANFCVLRKNSIEIKRRMIGYHCTPLMDLLVGHLVLKPFGPEMKHHPYKRLYFQVYSKYFSIHSWLLFAIDWLQLEPMDPIVSHVLPLVSEIVCCVVLTVTLVSRTKKLHVIALTDRLTGL